MTRPNLLLCFDAFGTLFKPRRSPALQYGEVARLCGITGFSDDELQSSLLAAIKEEARLNPNYGKSTGLGATKWWTNVIHKTFTPLIKKDQVLPKDLAPRLLHRFSSHEGYEAEPNLTSSVKALRSQRHFDNIVIGVITNSDDRVPSVLSSFGLNVSPLRYGMEVKDPPSALASRHYDIDFHCMSYDVGVEKPDKLIFTAAERMLARVLSLRDGKSHIDANEADVDETWRKVYVGDDYAKDVVGAVNAGWNPVLFGTAEQAPGNLPRLEDYPDRTPDDMFREHAVTRVDSLQNLAKWFVGGVNR